LQQSVQSGNPVKFSGHFDERGVPGFSHHGCQVRKHRQCVSQRSQIARARGCQGNPRKDALDITDTAQDLSQRRVCLAGEQFPDGGMSFAQPSWSRKRLPTIVQKAAAVL
jgi:hypothetical protein